MVNKSWFDAGWVPTLFMIIGLLPSLAVASIECTNPDLEVSCVSGACSVSEAHTPMQVTVGKQLEVCAYSGCTRYTFKKVKSPSFDIFHAERGIASQDDQLKTAPMALVVDKNDGVGVLKYDALVIPLSCKRVD